MRVISLFGIIVLGVIVLISIIRIVTEQLNLDVLVILMLAVNLLFRDIHDVCQEKNDG